MDDSILPYAGVGARSTPDDVLLLMERVGQVLARKGYLLRSGGAHGADSAFERGCDSVDGNKTIYLPWSGYNDRMADNVGVLALSGSEWATQIASEAHPAWEKLSRGVRAMHSRNCFQVLGHLTKGDQLVAPSKFVICWTPGGKGGGGTGQAIRIAKRFGIPVFDLAIPDVRKRIETMCNSS